MDEKFLHAHEAIAFARENSTYYKRLYQSVQKDDPDLEDVPIIYPDDYWNSARTDLSSVMTGPFTTGNIHCISGPTNKLELVQLSRGEEFKLSRAKSILWQEILEPEKVERIANIMSPHDLHIGFWDTVNISNGLLVPELGVQLFISNEKTVDRIMEEVERFQPNIVFGSLPDIFRLSEHLGEGHHTLPSVQAILYLGDTVPRDIIRSLHAGFPNARLYAPLYDKPQLGPLAFPGAIPIMIDRDINPIYRVCDYVVVMEIVTDDGTVIKQTGVKGNIIITHLIRRLQPLIRYPIGDVAEWVDYGSRIFKYCGKASTKIKVANTILDWSTLKDITSDVMKTNVSGRFQCVLRLQDGCQKLVLRLAYPRPLEAGEFRHKIEKALWKTSSTWKNERQAGVILCLRLEWVDDILLCVGETGELLDVVDER
ncbi:AMP-dependent synthetase/ligase [Daldinia childiae]|uniref:AMP-dependent synthetase/ligase n=1 Tax=Daldinia childiae TaxID=326645 RepID=UPI00144584C3|nr:AMP-dependent synthetase/ligase [Daldinia childiae]KAF3055871.1 AMP-dependent synthetase/ligase [Daldinia childiae]